MKILVFGGDKRQIYTAEYLADKGHEVVISGIDGYQNESPRNQENEFGTASEFDAVVFGIPSFDGKGKIKCPLLTKSFHLADVLEPCCTAKIFCAMLSSYEKAFMREIKADYSDYSVSERFCMLNSLLTAECALRVLMENSETAIFNLNVCVTGYGRIGEMLSDRLHALGANVTILARSEKALFKAECMGMNTLALGHLLHFREFDFVINTIPAVLFGEEYFERCVHTKYVELASSPGGLDTEAVLLLGPNYIKASSLPGKFVPKSAGQIIGKCIEEML